MKPQGRRDKGSHTKVWVNSWPAHIFFMSQLVRASFNLMLSVDFIIFACDLTPKESSY